ncbi:hypothetical protein [Actinacidiphila oryziradicis]|uniref:hypothetical protein n=1 Tax=Actinacidiphila oryziradicis TaxID=2571141 RepID=UPI0038991B49
MLVLYTDGVIEARSPTGAFYPLAERVASFPPLPAPTKAGGCLAKGNAGRSPPTARRQFGEAKARAVDPGVAGLRSAGAVREVRCAVGEFAGPGAVGCDAARAAARGGEGLVVDDGAASRPCSTSRERRFPLRGLWGPGLPRT